MSKRIRIVAACGVVIVVAAVISGFVLLPPSGPALPAWTPSARPAAPAVTTVRGQVVADHLCSGPRSVAVDATGRVYAACGDGSVSTLASNASTYSVFSANAGNSVFGLGFGPLGGLIVAGGRAGLLHVGGRPEPTVLAPAKGTTDAGLNLVSGVDDLKLTPELLFVNASDRAPRPQAASTLLEHGARGGLYRYDLRAHQATRLLADLQSPLAVAAGADDAYALVAETGAYRILRYWLKGDHAGTTEVFADNLPGFVTSLSFNRSGRFWAALPEPRSGMFDALASQPGLRRLLARLPWGWLPQPDRSIALAFDPDGHVVAAIRLAPLSGAGRMTSVVEHGPWLWLGSDRASALVRVPLQTLIASAPVPPAGWQGAPREAKALSIKVDQDDD